MKRSLLRIAATSILFICLSGTTAVVNAEHVEIEAVFPDSVATGDIMDLRVIVRTASGQRIPDATVIASEQATIAGVTDDVELARGVTNDLGIARLHWTVRTAPALAITITYASPDESQFETFELPAVDVTAGGQLERSTSGVQIPGFGAWVLIGVLVGVWGLIQFALSGPVRVAANSIDSTHPRADDDVDTPDLHQDEEAEVVS